ncbi:MAG: HDIG domain-containing metalloprotein, partial [Chlamydiales bacterium]
FFHFRKESAKVLEVGTTATRFITSQIVFKFMVEEATQVLRREAARDIGVIYSTKVDEVKRKCSEVADQLKNAEEWRHSFPDVSFEKIVKGLEQIESALVQARHTDARTLHRVKPLLPDESDLFLTLMAQEGKLPEPFWLHLKDNLQTQVGLKGSSLDYLLSFFEGTPWQLEEDAIVERSFIKSIEETIPAKITKVRAGTHIICPGEKVTHRHVAMFNAMTHALGKERDHWHPFSLLGTCLMGSIFTIAASTFLRTRHPKGYANVQQLSLMVGIIILTFLFFKLQEYFLFAGQIFADLTPYPLILPFATILLSILIGWEVALFGSLGLAVALALATGGDQVRIFIFNILASLVALIWGSKLYKKREVFAICGKIFVTTIAISLAFHLWDHTMHGQVIAFELLTSFVFLFLTAAGAVGLLTVVESLFPMVTDMALVEYMDPHHPLLRKLSVEAPGTYQHSLVVGSLAESAARAIGASGLFCRVSALYHDIGKLLNPHYFFENQLSGFNMHQLLTPQESAQVIIAHVTEGERLARKHRLPTQFIDIIREHHGTQLVYYFYAKELEELGEKRKEIDEKKFRYPGPKPQTK